MTGWIKLPGVKKKELSVTIYMLTVSNEPKLQNGAHFTSLNVVSLAWLKAKVPCQKPSCHDGVT